MAGKRDDFDERPPRRRGKRAHQSNRGLIIGLSVGGCALLVLLVVLLIGSSRGWFRKSNPPIIPGPVEQNAFAPVVTPKKSTPKLPNKELQRIFARITLEQWPVATVEKTLGQGREATSAEVDGLFAHVAFKKQIFEQFDKYRQELKVQCWLIWEREGDLLILGLSRFKSGKSGISMMGIWNENGRAFFNMSPRANAVDIE